MNKERTEFYKEGLKQLPEEIKVFSDKEGRNGETLCCYDEAEVWKRVLDYRIAKFMKPKTILETHTGLGIATKIYKIASEESKIISLDDYAKQIVNIKNKSVDFLDIDPFGQPYHCLEMALDKMKDTSVICISNGEMISVIRNLKNGKIKSDYYGKNSYKWVEKQYIPYIEDITGYKCAFYYIFPTTVRLILCKNIILPKEIFEGCKKYMWWISKYVE